MQNLIPKFRQNSTVFEKTSILADKLKTLTNLKICTRFLPTKVYKDVFGNVLFSLDLKLFTKLKKDFVTETRFFISLLITKDPNKIK